MTRSFLFTTWEGGGSVTPALTAVAKLAARGHRVRVMSDLCNRREAEAAGAEFIPWTRAPSRPDRSRETDILRDWDVAEPIDGLGRLVDQIMVGPALAYARDVMEELRRDPADLVVSSEMLPGVSAGCEALGQPLALLAVNVSIFPLPGIPPLGPGLVPPRNAAEQAMQDRIRTQTIAYFDRWLPVLNTARRKLGLAPLASLAEHPFRSRKLLLATARSFDFAPEVLPQGIAYVGPQIGEPAWAEPWRSPWAANDPRTLVAVCFSTSFQNHTAVLQRVADAISGLGLRGVITLGDTIAADELEPREGVALVHSAPHNALMAEAGLVITHGGHGTVMRALMHRKPMLVIPHGRDQNDNAVRVTERLAGLSLPADSPAEAIADALSRLHSDPRYAEGARRLGDSVAAETEGSPVVEELEALANPDSAVEPRLCFA
jgi:MGT family glycosyltransferase